MSKTVENYAVIGGQYVAVCYGVRDSIHAAKLLASSHIQYWDNWQGWHYPGIYRASDCARDAQGNIYPRPFVNPVATRGYGDKKWTIREDVDRC